MGEFGIPSRLLTGRYGAPFTYATFNKERTMAPGQLALEEMRDVYHYDRIDKHTKIYGVLADPVAHSMSPLIHNAAFAHERLNRVYLPFRVPKDALPPTINAFDWFPVEGYSVTLPHKEDVLALANQNVGPIREIGAANTLYRGDDGAWRVANTDHDAALECLVRELQPDPAAGTDPSLSALAGRKVLILGAGGVARAIARGIVNHGGVLMIANRTKARAEEFAGLFGCLLVEWQNRGAVFADVLINCTSVGMHPNLDETPFAENWLREGMLVFDTIYNPERTLLIKQARERECRTVTGVDMFVRQAAQQFELFTGRAAPVEVMRDVVHRAISAARPE
jgi:3-dehydroquinate dehydratase/shikimate dehydrogenase